MVRLYQCMFVFILFWTTAAWKKPVVKPNRRSPVPGRYMVKLKEICDVDRTAESLNRRINPSSKMHHGPYGPRQHGANRPAPPAWTKSRRPQVRFVFKKVFHGLSMENISPGLLQQILRDDCVEYVEGVGLVKVGQSVGASLPPVTMVHGNYLNWGLDRITEHVHDKSRYTYNPTGNGTGIDIYIVDSGVRRTHLEFGGRASFLNVFNKPSELIDNSGHGTQVAGIAIGAWRGAAPGANVISVKVLDQYGEGPTDDLLEALIKILEDKPLGNAVVSMSFVSDTDYSYIHDAIIDLVNANFVVVAAAGNQNDNACFYYPAGYPEVISVGAINAKGHMASFSNYGPCVDIYAPGANIYTATNEGDDQIKKMKGTSFAAPFVSGAAAILLEQDHAPANIKSTLILNSIKSVPIKYLPSGSYNRILYISPVAQT